MIKLAVRFIIFCLIITGSVFYFTTTTELSGSGNKIANLRQEVEMLDYQNRILSSQLSQRYFLGEVEEQAVDQGMVSNAKFVYVKIPSSLVVSRR